MGTPDALPVFLLGVGLQAAPLKRDRLVAQDLIDGSFQVWVQVGVTADRADAGAKRLIRGRG